MTLFKCRNFATKQVENVFELQVACSTFIDGLFGVGKSIHCKFFRRLPFVVFVATRRRVAVLGGVLQKFCDNRRALPVFFYNGCANFVNKYSLRFDFFPLRKVVGRCFILFHICERFGRKLFFDFLFLQSLQIAPVVVVYMLDIVWRAKDESYFQRPFEGSH